MRIVYNDELGEVDVGTIVRGRIDRHTLLKITDKKRCYDDVYIYKVVNTQNNVYHGVIFSYMAYEKVTNKE